MTEDGSKEACKDGGAMEEQEEEGLCKTLYSPAILRIATLFFLWLGGVFFSLGSYIVRQDGSICDQSESVLNS